MRTRPEGKFLVISLGEEKRVVPASERDVPSAPRGGTGGSVLQILNPDAPTVKP